MHKIKSVLVGFGRKISNLDQNHKILLILAAGILVRLILMPLSGHDDILRTYERAYETAFQRVNILEFGQELSHGIEAIYLKFLSIFINKDTFLPFQNLTPDLNPFVMRNMFLFKLPYLIFDVFAFFLIKKITEKKKYQLWSLAFYFLNPILLFAVYMYGRYETFPIFFLLLSLLFLKRKRNYISLFFFGLTILTRQSYLLLAPVYILSIGRNWKEKIKLSVVALLPFVIGLIVKDLFMQNTNEINWLTTGYQTSFLFSPKIELRIGLFVYPFIVLYFLLCTLTAYIWIQKKQNFNITVMLLCAVLLIYQTFSYVRPPYHAWIIPLICLTLMNKKIRNWILAMSAVFVTGFYFHLFYWQSPCLLWGLWAPLGHNIATNCIAQNLMANDTMSLVVGIGRTVMTSTSFVIMFILGKKIYTLYKKDNKTLVPLQTKNDE